MFLLPYQSESFALIIDQSRAPHHLRRTIVQKGTVRFKRWCRENCGCSAFWIQIFIFQICSVFSALRRINYFVLKKLRVLFFCISVFGCYKPDSGYLFKVIETEQEDNQPRQVKLKLQTTEIQLQVTEEVNTNDLKLSFLSGHQHSHTHAECSSSHSFGLREVTISGWPPVKPQQRGSV